MSAALLNPTNLRPCGHQVGGHMSKDSQPESFVDDEGRFYKPFTDGARAERELQFYRSVWPPAGPGPRPHAPHPSLGADEAATLASTAVNGEATPSPSPQPSVPSAEPKLEDIEGLQPFIARYYGTLEHKGRTLIALEDMCQPYSRPCVMDCKIGFTTVYPWADERYKAKFKAKDANTTQGALGVRVCGLQVLRADGVVKPEREWSRRLTTETIGEAFRMFASGDHLSARDLYCHPEHGALRQLRAFLAWAERQTSFWFFQSSVLFIYEGEATDMSQARVRVAWVDFAHAFQSLGGARDENLVGGLKSLIALLEAGAAAEDVEAKAHQVAAA